MSTGHQPDRQFLPLTGRPEPVNGAIRPPALLMRLVKREAKAEHARPLPPILDDVLLVRRLQIEIAEDAEPARIRLYRFDRLNVGRFAERAGRMDDRSIDA